MSKSVAGWGFVLLAIAFYAVAWGAESFDDAFPWAAFDEEGRLHWQGATMMGLVCGTAGLWLLLGGVWPCVLALGVCLSVNAESHILQGDGEVGQCFRLTLRFCFLTLVLPILVLVMNWKERHDIEQLGRDEG